MSRSCPMAAEMGILMRCFRSFLLRRIISLLISSSETYAKSAKSLFEKIDTCLIGKLFESTAMNASASFEGLSKEKILTLWYLFSFAFLTAPATSLTVSSPNDWISTASARFFNISVSRTVLSHTKSLYFKSSSLIVDRIIASCFLILFSRNMPITTNTMIAVNADRIIRSLISLPLLASRRYAVTKTPLQKIKRSKKQANSVLPLL